MSLQRYLIPSILTLFIYACNDQAIDHTVKTKVNSNDTIPGSFYLNENNHLKKLARMKNQNITPGKLETSSTTDLNNAQGISAIYKLFDKPPQLFSISALRDTTLICAEGTSIKIKANSFVSVNSGKEIIDKVQISIQEYYKISDILLAKLSTTSEGNLLETGGMIHITASTGKENCVLKKGTNIEIKFPADNAKEDMKLYQGDWENDCTINWTILPESVDQNQVYSTVDESPTFPGGEYMLAKYISENTRYPQNEKENGIQGKVTIAMIIGKDGSVQSARVLEGLTTSCDHAALDVVKQMPKFNPGKINGEAVNVNFNLTITFTILSEEGSYSYNYKQDFEKSYNDKTLSKASTTQISSYLFSSSALGWINCDRLWKNTTSDKTDYIVSLNCSEEHNSMIVFHRLKSIMNGASIGGSSVFKNIPTGEKITLIAIKFDHKVPFMAVKETTTSQTLENDLIFQPVTMANLKREIEKLDRFN